MNADLLARLGRIQTMLLVIGLAALGLTACGLGNPRQFFFSYAFAWLFWFGLSVGCLLITMIHQLTGGRWGYPTRRFLEAGFMVLPLMLLLMVPLFFGLRELYPWARPEEVAIEKALQHRQGYQNQWAYILRAAFVLVVFCGMGMYLRWRSLEQDATTDARPTRRARTLSGPGLIVVPLLATTAYVDWIMSLEPRWHSTLFAIIVLAGQILVTFAFAVLMMILFRKQEPLARVVTRTHYHHLGNLLLTFVIFWTYVSFGQLLIIYSGDLPPELDWYLHRISGNWKWIITVLALFHFFVPFFLLLFRAVKLHAWPLSTLAGMIFIAHIVEAYWLVMPSFHQHGLAVSWMDFTAPLGIGSLWISCFLSRLRRAPLVPQHDPGMQFAFSYGHQVQT